MNIAEYNTCVEKYSKMVYRISFHYSGNKQDAEDVSQDVFDSGLTVDEWYEMAEDLLNQ